MSAHLRTLTLLLVAAASCAKPEAKTPGPAGSNPNPATVTDGKGTATTTRVARNGDVIGYAELQEPSIAGTDAMTAIRQLRPAFFRTRGPMSFSNATAGLVQVSQDYGPLQPVSQLSAMDTRSLQEVRYLNAVDAQTRFGINANGGPVIVLLTSKSAK